MTRRAKIVAMTSSQMLLQLLCIRYDDWDNDGEYWPKEVDDTSCSQFWTERSSAHNEKSIGDVIDVAYAPVE